jgi:hypothetical protein
VWKLRPSPILPRRRTVQRLSTIAAVAINNLIRRAILDQYKYTRPRRRALEICMGQQDTMTNNREKYPLQAQTTKVAPEALDFFSNRPVTMWNYSVQRQVQEHNKEITPEAMPNYLSITIHLIFQPSSKATIPRSSSVEADIIK